MAPGVEGLKYKATVHKSSASTDHSFNFQHLGSQARRKIQAGRHLSRSNLQLQAGQAVRSDQVTQGSYSILSYLYFPSDIACFQASLFPPVLQTCCVYCCQGCPFLWTTSVLMLPASFILFYEVPELQTAIVWPLLRELSQNLSSTCHVNWTTKIHYLDDFSVLP